MSDKGSFLNAVLRRKSSAPENGEEILRSRMSAASASVSFADHPLYERVRMLKTAARRIGLGDPFFRVHEGRGGARTVIAGKEYLNFSHYNYLGLNGHPEVCAAAKNAVDKYGTSAGASRLVAGERPVVEELENALAKIYDAPACAVFVSGHATNISVISTLFGPRDLVIHDALIHNSVLEGIRAAGAARKPYPHNDMDALERILAESRRGYEKILVVAEGHYSMDGDVVDLPRLLELKKRAGAFLMVDEAHSLGVLGAAGKGVAEMYGVDPREVDIWMGTLSKTLASCGGYVAGSAELIEILKSAAPGFVYSVGMSPPLGAASLKALEIMRAEPWRVAKLRENGKLFLELARRSGLNPGLSVGAAIVPVILGSSRKSIELSNALFENGINAQPIIHPAVEERASRLRFFLTAEHTEEDIRRCCRTTAKLLGAKGDAA